MALPGARAAMKMNEARAVLAALPEGSRRLRSAAHDRYMYFAGVYTDRAGATLATADRAAFGQLLQFTPDGRPSISDERCARFMAAFSGLPTHWCLAWEAMQFAGASVGAEDVGHQAPVAPVRAGR